MNNRFVSGRIQKLQLRKLKQRDEILDSPKRLISHWDVYQLFAIQFVVDFERFLDAKKAYEEADRKFPGGSLPADSFPKLHQIYSRMTDACVKLGLQLSIQRTLDFRNRLDLGVCNVSLVMVDMQGLYKSIRLELDKRKYFSVSPNKADYFNNLNLFGFNFAKSFPLTSVEIFEAGNCFAANLHTAAVFHLMRGINASLRALARSLGVKKVGDRELEYCTDGKIFGALNVPIELKLKALNARVPHDDIWDKDNSFYKWIKTDLEYFKDVFRDTVAHARKSYTEKGAEDVFDHVRGFMKRLAEYGVKEDL
jgi:hypothetical protein